VIYQIAPLTLSNTHCSDMSASANLKIQHYRLTYRLMQLLTATNVIYSLSLVTIKRLFTLSRTQPSINVS